MPVESLTDKRLPPFFLSYISFSAIYSNANISPFPPLFQQCTPPHTHNNKSVR